MSGGPWETAISHLDAEKWEKKDKIQPLIFPLKVTRKASATVILPKREQVLGPVPCEP
jgi:hypothetical protein